MPRPVIDELLKDHFLLLDEAIHEIVSTSFDTTEEDVEQLAAIGKRL